MNVNELAERESARVVRFLSLAGISPEQVETIRVSVAASVAFAYGEGVHDGISMTKKGEDIKLLDWSGDRPRINNIHEWIK